MRAPSSIRIGCIGFFLMLLFFLAACGGGTASQTPTANAEPNQSSTTGATVSLNGSGSTNPAGKSLTYKWAVVSQPSGNTASSRPLLPTLTASTSSP